MEKITGEYVFSRLPRRAEDACAAGSSTRPAPASCAFVPSVAGLIMAGEVIKDLVSGACGS